MQELTGQRALVTGGTSGIGRATAEALAREGARVLISGRTEARGAEVVAAIEAGGGDRMTWWATPQPYIRDPGTVMVQCDHDPML
jgi:NAD(P)-dependent dehydrogenase (short-subunit alcohol dehydrogenase family)